MEAKLCARSIVASLRGPALASAGVIAGSLGAAQAQTTFSIDYRGPTNGVFVGAPISNGDVLSPVTGFPAFGPLPPPLILVPHGPPPLGLGLPAGPACAPPGVLCADELDALSYGFDGPLTPGNPPGSFKFSVSRSALGIPAPAAPNVMTEAAAGEVAADVFITLALPPGPLPPFASPPFNTRMVDGDGAPPFLGPALGLLEPHGPNCAGVVSAGDNLDALDIDGPVGWPIYFSLEGAGVDVCGFPRSASAPLLGLPPGGILSVAGPGAPIFVYAPAPLLGLDLVAGPGTDDIDALVVFEDGVLGYTPSPGAYAWAPLAPFDMVLFSVTATSALVGAPDSIFGMPIEPGDILIPPVAGGLSPFPGIFIAAENLALSTLRSGFAARDELDALDVTAVPVFDCNGNLMEDALEIAGGGDCNGNGVLDVCESSVSVYCTSAVSVNGCSASIAGVGIPSASFACPFSVQASGVDGQRAGIVFYGVSGATASPWGAGFLCVKTPVQRTGIKNSGGTAGLCDGVLSLDFNAYMSAHPVALGQPLAAGQAFHAQAWFRDPWAVKASNMSDGLRFVLAP